MSRAEEFDGCLYRAVDEGRLAEVLAHGYTSDHLTYWGTADIAAYYAETIRDEGKRPVFVIAKICAFDQAQLEPDMPGIEEPLTFTLKMSEEEVWDAWKATDGSWQASLNLIGSVAYRGALAKRGLMIAYEDGHFPNFDALSGDIIDSEETPWSTPLRDTPDLHSLLPKKLSQPSPTRFRR
jgi:hypothetical protein